MPSLLFYRHNKGVCESCGLDLSQLALRVCLFVKGAHLHPVEHVRLCSGLLGLFGQACLLGNAWDFLEDGKIDDKWGNDRGWSVEDDSLVIRTKQNEKKVTVLEVYDGGYVLLKDGQYYATFYKVEE